MREENKIEKWSPNSSDSSWTVSLPWGLSWSWNTQDSVSVENNGSTSSNYAEWLISYRWYQTSLSNPTLFRPGTAWLSKASARKAAINISSSGTVRYNGELKNVTQDHGYTYRY